MRISTNRYVRYKNEIQEIKKDLVIAEEDVKVARQKRDLSENTEYEEARRRRESLQTRLNLLEVTLQKATVAEPSTNIDIGTLIRVTLLDRNDEPKGDSRLFMIEETGDTITEGVLALNTPLGRVIKNRNSGRYDCTNAAGQVITYWVEIDNTEEAKKEFEELYPLSKQTAFEQLFR